MSRDIEKDAPESTENDSLLENQNDLVTPCYSVSSEEPSQRYHYHHYHHHYHHHHHHHRRQQRYQQNNCKSLASNEKSNRKGLTTAIVDGLSHGVTSATLPSIIVSDVDENEEDPPPYSTIVPPDHVGWPFVFSTHIPYSVHATQPCITEPPLAPFQTLQLTQPLPLPVPTSQSLASIPPIQPFSIQTPTTTHRVEAPSLDRPTPTLPLTPYRFFKFVSPRSIIGHRSSIYNENVPPRGKQVPRRSKRYGGILIAASVIVFLMVLSLMVRFVMKRIFWRR